MTTAYATSDDGLAWTWHGTALAPRPGAWDARGARLTALLTGGGATYDGRASKEENFGERTGLARAGRQVVAAAARSRWPRCATSTSWPRPAAATGSTTRRRCPTAATSCAPSSFP